MVGVYHGYHAIAILSLHCLTIWPLSRAPQGHLFQKLVRPPTDGSGCCWKALFGLILGSATIVNCDAQIPYFEQTSPIHQFGIQLALAHQQSSNIDLVRRVLSFFDGSVFNALIDTAPQVFVVGSA